ncbi:MAG: MAE_28990/MAE_18760 family HEPN-like nuclease [Pleurocapsa sp.]
MECRSIIDALQKDIPKTQEWRIYDHCAAVTKLYAIYENFVEDLIKDWLRLLPELFLNYDDLDDRIRNTHQSGVGKTWSINR